MTETQSSITKEEWDLFNEVLKNIPRKHAYQFLLTKAERDAIDKILRLNPYYNTKRERVDAIHNYIKENESKTNEVRV